MRRSGHAGGRDEVFGPGLVQRHRKREGVGAEAWNVGHLQQDGRIGLAVAATGAFSDVEGGVKIEPGVELFAKIEGRSHTNRRVAEVLHGRDQGVDRLVRLVLRVGIRRRVVRPRVRVEGVVDESDAHKGLHVLRIAYSVDPALYALQNTK